MASVPRRGAEIWAAKVFWRKTKKSRKCIFNIEAHPDAFICIKMVLRGTNSSHMKTYITVDHSGGIHLEIIHFEPKISRKYTRYKARIRENPKWLCWAHFSYKLPRVARGSSYMCTKWRQLMILSGSLIGFYQPISGLRDDSKIMSSIFKTF